MHTIYKITNQVNNKSYIGITKNKIEDRWEKHVVDSNTPLYPLHCAIQKYGKENFTIEVLLELDNREKISSLEQPMIELHESHISKNGYNVAKGGYGGDLGDAANRKRSQTMRNKSDEEKQLWISKRNITISGRNKNNHKGKLAQSLSMIGNQHASGLVHSPETKRIIGDANRKPKEHETRQKMSASAIINQNSLRFSDRRATCLCCQKEWDIGNYTQHIRKQDELQ